jgi:hypothetical protein
MSLRGDAPLNIGAGDGKVVEPLLHERDDLVAPVIRFYELGIVLIQIQQAALERRQLEKIVLFGDCFCGAPAFRTQISGLGIVDVQLIIDAVLAGVTTFVDVSVALAALKEPPDGLMMIGVGGADKVVVIDAQLFPEAGEFRDHSGAVFVGTEVSGLGGLLHVAAMFVGAGGQHNRIKAFHFLEALHQVGNEGGVGGANVRRGIDVVNGCREVVFRHRMFLR